MPTRSFKAAIRLDRFYQPHVPTKTQRAITRGAPSRFQTPRAVKRDFFDRKERARVAAQIAQLLDRRSQFLPCAPHGPYSKEAHERHVNSNPFC